MKKFAMAFVLVLCMSGASFAQDVEINIYGASAQIDFWAASAPVYLTAATGANCTGSVGTCTASFSPADNTPAGVYYHGAKYVTCEATGPCSGAGLATADKLRIRVGAYDSDDGIMGVLGQANPGAVDVMNCPTGSGLNYRTLLNTVAGGAAITNLNCFPVTLGTADVHGSTIIQKTQGQLKGPLGPVSVTNGLSLLPGGAAGPAIPRDLGNFVATPPTVKTCGPGSVGLTDHHPFIVPFCFFANKDAKVVGDGLLQANLTNVTKTMAQQIFTGVVTDWHTYFPGIPAGSTIKGCMRVAGSGTQAAFHSAVITSNKIGPNLPVKDHSLLGNNLWFNNSSTDMLNCINFGPGFIGFVDCDKAPLANMTGPLTYDGFAGNTVNIQDGLYEFWTLEHLFEPAVKYSGYPTTAVTNLVNWADANPTIPASHVGTWSTSDTMQFHKTGDWITPPQVGPYVLGTCYE